MKHLTQILIAFCMFGCWTNILAQSTIPATGSSVSGSGGTVDYTVGQVLFSIITGTNGTLAQGVQQPYEISVATGSEEALEISLEMDVYPNPAMDFVKLRIKDNEAGYLIYHLYDINGSLLEEDKVEGNETSIPMSELLPSTYFLKVTDKNKVIGTFKIVKH